jgi:hypothetical protein
MSLIGILGMVVALVAGIYWGLPDRYTPPLDELEESLSETGKEHGRVKRRETFLTILQRKVERGSDRRRRERGRRRPFRLSDD